MKFCYGSKVINGLFSKSVMKVQFSIHKELQLVSCHSLNIYEIPFLFHSKRNFITDKFTKIKYHLNLEITYIFSSQKYICKFLTMVEKKFSKHKLSTSSYKRCLFIMLSHQNAAMKNYVKYCLEFSFVDT